MSWRYSRDLPISSLMMAPTKMLSDWDRRGQAQWFNCRSSLAWQYPRVKWDHYFITRGGMMLGLTSSWHCLMASWSELLTAALAEVTVRLERRLYLGAGADLSSSFGKLWEGATLSSSLSISLSLEMLVPPPFP